MDRSVAQGRPPGAETDLDTELWTDPGVARSAAVVIGLLLVLAAMAVYGLTYTARYYDHFVWQAAAFLEGHAAIRYPVAGTGGVLGNIDFQDVLPIVTTDGIPRGLLPFPPLPAVLLIPFVAVWGLATNAQVIYTILAAVDVAICWWAIGRLPIGAAVRLGTTIFFAFGTVFWYTAQQATTWYQAHIVAVGLTFLAIGLAVRDDPDAVASDEPGRTGRAGRIATSSRGLWARIRVDRRQFLAGFLFGLACTARLTVVFGAPFFIFVGAGGGWRRRMWSAGLGAAIPIGILLAYTLVSTGHLTNPAYDYLYRLEVAGYPALGYHADWAIEDIRYAVQNLGIALFGTPDLFPATLPDSLGIAPVAVCLDPSVGRGLFDIDCPLALPRATGMSVLLTSPAYLLAIPAVVALRRRRIVSGAVIAVALIVLVDLMHFSQGWVQFGYRFSNDAAPFALLLVALGFERMAVRHRWGMLAGMSVVVLSVAVNAWGVLWSRILGW